MELKENKNQIELVYKPDVTILCKITSVSKSFFNVETSTREKGLVYIGDVSDYYVNSLPDMFKEGDILYLAYKETKNGIHHFSFKRNRTMFLKTPFNFDLGNEESNSGFQNLFDFTNKEIKKWKK